MRFDLDPARLQHLARVMRDLRQNGMQSAEPLPGYAELENAMWPQGSGLFKDSDGVYQIVRIDGDRRFASDDEAFRHVESLAAMGEPLHEQAMSFNLTGSLEPELTVRP